MRETKRSEELFNSAQQYLPGGVNSPVRAFKSVGGSPLFIERGSGSRIFDVDGNEYVDYVSSWGPLILGHAHPQVIETITRTIMRGTCFGAPSEAEVILAKLICEAMPSIAMVRMVTSGTEAVMSAIRLARAFTGREKILKFDGCYHGHSDGLLVKAGSGVATLGIPDSPGVPGSFTRQTLTVPYNDTVAVNQIFAEYGSEIAAVIVEPIAANMGVILPEPGFLESLRELTVRHGALLIFDEVITGFRVAYGGAQSIFGVIPDLTCLGKIIGGGLPVGAYGGRRDIMQLVAPAGPVYQAGTLAGSPVAMAAGIATLSILKNLDIYTQLEAKALTIRRGITEVLSEQGIKGCVKGTGSLFTLFFSDENMVNYASVCTTDTNSYARFFHRMLCRGIYFPPSQFETAFISAAHSNDDIEKTIEAARQTLKKFI